MSSSRVIQAFFPDRKAPVKSGVQRFARTLLAADTTPAHAARRPVAGAAVDSRLRAPHAATAQPMAQSGRPPHPATVARARVTAALQPKSDVRAFRTPNGFLGGQKSGEALPAAVCRQMEAYFQADFSDVRVHVGGEAAAIGALAFTVGTDLYFAPGQYQPHTQSGRELLGHELTHVVQQREGRVSNPFGAGVAVVHDEELEAEADRHGRAAAQAKLTATPRDFGRPRIAQPASREDGASGYQLVVGAYLHDSAQPEALAGHSFVAIEDPSGERRAFGFSPAHYGSYDPHRDLGRLKMGVKGVVHDDSGAFDKPGVKTRAYPVTRDQADAAIAKVSEYQSGRYRYSADRRQCATFVSDVMNAAGVAGEELPQPPRYFYEALDADEP
jgi:hypothetical protein